MIVWNPWHGCHKISEGCQNCYMFRRDATFGKDSTVVTQTKDFHLPIMRNRSHVYRLTSRDNPIYVCLTSDFLIEEADRWRSTVWDMIRYRSDLHFKIITKRIHRFNECLPKDLFRCYDNVTVVCTCENQRTADERLPLLLAAKALHKEIIHEPMLERIDIEPYLASGEIEAVTCGGESGDNARICDYDWILHTRKQCMQHQVAFHFKQTGARFRKDGRIFHIERRLQAAQAHKADMDYCPVDEEEPFCRYEYVLAYLQKSPYMRKCFLLPAQKQYCREKGMDYLRRQADDMIRKNLMPAWSDNRYQHPSGSVSPLVIAQQATACNSRKRLFEWHDILPDHRLKEKEIIYVVGVMLAWIQKQLAGSSEQKAITPSVTTDVICTTSTAQEVSVTPEPVFADSTAQEVSVTPEPVFADSTTQEVSVTPEPVFADSTAQEVSITQESVPVVGDVSKVVEE